MNARGQSAGRDHGSLTNNARRGALFERDSRRVPGPRDGGRLFKRRLLVEDGLSSLGGKREKYESRNDDHGSALESA
jgi:hypothetical protein